MAREANHAKPQAQEDTDARQICAPSVPAASMIAGAMVRDSIARQIRQSRPDIDVRSPICPSCNARFRAEYARSLLEQDRAGLSTLDEQVIFALRDQSLIAVNINEEFGERLIEIQQLQMVLMEEIGQIHNGGSGA